MVATSSLPITKEVANSLKNSMFSRNFNSFSTDKYLILATILDPRFKLYGFKTDESLSYAKRLLRGEIVKVKLPQPPTPTTDLAPSNSIWSSLDYKIHQNTTQNDAQAIKEMDIYLSDSIPPRTSDPFIWWQNKRSSYPRLLCLFKHYHCILMNSVSCERVFSKLGQIVTDRRNRLTINKIGKIGMIAESRNNLSIEAK